MTRKLYGKPVADALLDEVRSHLTNRGSRPVPVLASVHVGEGGPFAFYLKQQERTARAVGVGFREIALPETTTPESLLASLETLQADPTVHAVLLQHPLPAGLDFQRAVDALSPEKDVDGVSSRNLGHLVEGQPIQAPAVALGVLQILRFYDVAIGGRRVAVVGRSSTVGRPIALLLSARGGSGDGTVTLAHSRTPRLADALAGSQVIVSCAGVPGLIHRGVVPKDSVVIDVGLSSVPDPSAPSGVRGVGDADAASLEGWAEALTPVPGGVGPVTAAQLMWNVVTGWERQSGDHR